QGWGWVVVQRVTGWAVENQVPEPTNVASCGGDVAEWLSRLVRQPRQPTSQRATTLYQTWFEDTTERPGAADVPALGPRGVHGLRGAGRRSLATPGDNPGNSSPRSGTRMLGP